MSLLGANMNQSWDHAIQRNMRTARVFNQSLSHEYLPWAPSINRSYVWGFVWISLMLVSLYLIN